MPGGTLADAVVALGRQAGISIGIGDPALARRRVGRLRGSFTVEEALGRMLRGSGAGWLAVDDRTFRIVMGPPGPRLARAAPRRAPAPPEPVRAAAEAEQIVVVTASKRATPLAHFPGAVELVGGDDPVLQYGLRGSEALVARLPAVTSTHLGPGRNKLFLRGIADSSFIGPTQATVGQYLGETRLNYNAPDPDLRLHDLDRVEILTGPQGTLYGAGSLGGIIRLVPAAPELGAVSADASAGVSTTAHGDPGYDASAMANLPISQDRLALRVVAYGASEGGYIDDVGRGEDDVNRTDLAGGRATLRGSPGGGWTVDLGGAFQQIDGEAQFADRDAPPLTRDGAVEQDFSNRYALGNLTVSREWGDGMRLVTSTGIVRQTLDERYDATPQGGAPTVFEQRTAVTLLSAEARLSRQRPGGAGWLIGTSLIRNTSEQSRAMGPEAAPLPVTGVRNAISEATLYGEAGVRVGPAVVATLGGRITHSRLSGAALDAPAQFAVLLRGVSASRSETALLPSASFSARVAPGLLLFARYQEGFRPGGLAVSGPLVQRFDGDRVRSFEGGLRYGRAGAGTFDAALSLAYTRWTDIQADLVDASGMPTTANIGDGTIYTLDLRAGWRPLPGLGLEVAAAYNESEVTEVAPAVTLLVARAAPLPNVARFSGRAAASYEAVLADGVNLRLDGALRYVGSSRLGIGPVLGPVLGQAHGDWLDASLGARVELGRHALTLGATNLLDEAGNRFALGSPFTLLDRPQVTPLRPRTFRLGWDVRF